MDIILASTSPRRHQLLALAAIDFSTLSVDVDETILPNEKPQDYIVRMVETKAQQACQHYQTKATNQDKDADSSRLIITADTIGVLADDHYILVKPKDKADAFAMWQQMSGTEHNIWTAVQLTLVNQQGETVASEQLLEKTQVQFIELDEQAMQAYWDTGEPQDKAGGYAIQGRGSVWVERINGSYSNVVGLPLAQTVAAIHKMQQHIV
ncbi:Maf family protein [Psychrobacter sp. FDAARGOS_221]|uniref:Maf family protein n=1 Tax=Psychrobacter sp. FDAARGOS_221 TaxID=1975705 RepID=UPI000BB555B1|nr:Maf family protein [Psychrobacter sp. FDAARGOS_221]PNK60333.1 septum formation protein Maf [Psychrobacter sp. FDAARGOS_221]